MFQHRYHTLILHVMLLYGHLMNFLWHIILNILGTYVDFVKIPQDIFHHIWPHGVLNPQRWKIVWHKFHIGKAVFLHEQLQYVPGMKN